MGGVGGGFLEKVGLSWALKDASILEVQAASWWEGQCKQRPESGTGGGVQIWMSKPDGRWATPGSIPVGGPSLSLHRVVLSAGLQPGILWLPPGAL